MGTESAEGSTFQRRKRRRVRMWLAGISLAVPALVIVLTWLVWHSELPELVAFHWDAAGKPDGAFPTEPLFWMTLIGAALFLLLGIIVLLVPSRDDRDTRTAITLLGTVSAFTAAAWVVPAGVTYFADSQSQAMLGDWLALFVVALAYGLIPRCLTPVATP